MKVLRKVLCVVILALICQLSIKNSFAVCELKSADTGEVMRTRDTNQSACAWFKGDTDYYGREWTSFGDGYGSRIATCRADGLWDFFECKYKNNAFDLSPYLCNETTSIKADCIKANKKCTSPDRQPNETICKEENVWRCDGYDGQYYLSQSCEEKDGSKTKCFEQNQNAKCTKIQCVQDSKKRDLDKSTCFGDYKNVCIKEGAFEDAKFEGNKPENLCKFGCIEPVEGYAECLSTFDQKTKCSEQDGGRLIQRTNGQTACFGDGTLRQCSKEKDGVFSIIEDCKGEKKKCQTINSEGIGECVDLSEPESPFEPPTVTVTGGGTNVFCAGNGPGTDNPKIETALGCIPIRTEKFVEWLLPYVFGITGGISFLLMVYSFILMATSGGDPKKVQGAKETITSAIVGLLISVFALFILRLIAVNILKIPGIN